MKIIYFIRHAKAKKIAATDFDRALSSKGKEAAKVMAARLKNKNILPELIISSPAKRTAKTAKIIAKNMNFSGCSALTNIGFDEFIGLESMDLHK